MSIEDEARTEAEKRYAPYAPDVSQFLESGFIAGAEWQPSRKPEAAPSCPVCRHAEHEGYQCLNMASDNECACDKRVNVEAAPSDTDREALTVGLAKYGPEWWSADDIQHMVSNLTEEDAPDRGSIAHEMWAMGAWLKHPKCRNNPKRGNDADYENECAVCEQYLLVVADAILGLRPSQPVQVEVTDEIVEKASLAILNRVTWPSLHWPNLDSLHNRDVRMAMARAALEAALGGGNS